MQGYSVFPFILGDRYSTFCGSSDGQSVVMTSHTIQNMALSHFLVRLDNSRL